MRSEKEVEAVVKGEVERVLKPQCESNAIHFTDKDLRNFKVS